jgi:hypothetical protein
MKRDGFAKGVLMVDEKRYDKSILIWSWLLPLAYLIHISEEYWGGGGYSAYMARVRGVHITPARFLFLNGLGWGLMLLGIYLARRLKFLEWLAICLCTVEAANGVSHTITAVATASYNPGLVSGLLIFIPLGLAGLYLLKNRMSRSRYATAMAVGITIQLIVSLLALSGGKTPAS